VPYTIYKINCDQEEAGVGPIPEEANRTPNVNPVIKGIGFEFEFIGCR
jgi:hypothetical protein